MNLVPQNEKRKMLMEHETSKLKDLDEEYATELREWKAQLKPRKQVTTTRPMGQRLIQIVMYSDLHSKNFVRWGFERRPPPLESLV